MNRRSRKERELEQRLKNIILKAKPDKPKKSKLQKIFTTLLFAATAIVLSAPLWFGWADRPETVNDPVYYKIQKVTIEYPDGMEPIIKLRPARSGCAFMPQTKRSLPLQSV